MIVVERLHCDVMWWKSCDNCEANIHTCQFEPRKTTRDTGHDHLTGYDQSEASRKVQSWKASFAGRIRRHKQQRGMHKMGCQISLLSGYTEVSEVEL